MIFVDLNYKSQACVQTRYPGQRAKSKHPDYFHIKKRNSSHTDITYLIDIIIDSFVQLSS